MNEASVISKFSVNEASGSLTTVVSGDVEAANGQPPLFFIVYVAVRAQCLTILLFKHFAPCGTITGSSSCSAKCIMLK